MCGVLQLIKSLLLTSNKQYHTWNALQLRVWYTYMKTTNATLDVDTIDSRKVQDLYNAARAAMKHKNREYYSAFRSLCQPSVIIQLIEEAMYVNQDKHH